MTKLARDDFHAALGRRCVLSGLAALSLGLAVPRLGRADGHATEVGDTTSDKGHPSAFAGMLYVMTNTAVDNAVVRYGRRVDGSLLYLDETLTGGVGSGDTILPINPVFGVATDPLVSADGLILTEDRKFLLAINGGDDTVSVFRVQHGGSLALRQRHASSGRIPVSIAIHGGLVYIANAGDFVSGEAPSIVGFRLSGEGTLTEIPDSTRTFPVPVGVPPSSRITDALFSPRGDTLVVVNTFSDEIYTFPVHDDGTLGAQNTTASAAPGPFGMVFIGDDVLAVTDSNAFAGIGASSVSTYKLRGHALKVISNAVPNFETEACWLSVTPDGRDLYSSNSPLSLVQGPATASISHYRVSRSGKIELAEAEADARGPNAELGQNAGPLESFIPEDGQFFYQLWTGLGEVAAYRIGRNGKLELIENGVGTGLPLISPTGMTGY